MSIHDPFIQVCKWVQVFLNDKEIREAFKNISEQTASNDKKESTDQKDHLVPMGCCAGRSDSTASSEKGKHVGVESTESSLLPPDINWHNILDKFCNNSLDVKEFGDLLDIGHKMQYVVVKEHCEKRINELRIVCTAGPTDEEKKKIVSITDGKEKEQYMDSIMNKIEEAHSEIYHCEKILKNLEKSQSDQKKMTLQLLSLVFNSDLKSVSPETNQKMEEFSPKFKTTFINIIKSLNDPNLNDHLKVNAIQSISDLTKELMTIILPT